MPAIVYQFPARPASPVDSETRQQDLVRFAAFWLSRGETAGSLRSWGARDPLFAAMADAVEGLSPVPVTVP